MPTMALLRNQPDIWIAFLRASLPRPLMLPILEMTCAHELPYYRRFTPTGVSE